MRLVVVGNLNGQLGAAARMVMDRGAAVRHADGIDTALAMLQHDPVQTAPGDDLAAELASELASDLGADLLVCDAAIDVAGLAARLATAGVVVPVLACATAATAATEAEADAGSDACGHCLPLPPQPEAIAAILAAIVDASPGDSGSQTAERSLHTARAAHAALTAAAVTPSLVGRTVADVERDLIVETLRRCLGNRTHAAAILGISVRTLRNKLTVYAAEGIDVPPPNQGEIRGAA